MTNTLYYGDNLAVLKELAQSYPEGCIDLIYVDPPFNSNRNYNILYQDLIRETNGDKARAQKEAFQDTWSNVEIRNQLEELKGLPNLSIHRFLEGNRPLFSAAQTSYLTMMALRLYYMRKVLKDTGSFYLHCDPTMSHYLKMLCDRVFGTEHFRNEIVWWYRKFGQGAKNFKKNHDIILYYCKNKDKVCFYELFEAFSPKTQKDKYKRVLVDGKWKVDKSVLMEDIRKRDGVPLSNTWEISFINSQSKERLGYPTQKPEALLERIIRASSKEGDLVADFFCGCGTTVTVAEKLKRRWIGVDISHLAMGLIEEKRLKPLKANYEVRGFPKDLASAEKLAKDDPYMFQDWVVEYLLKGHSQIKKSADGGYDGHVAFNWQQQRLLCLIEVKGGGCNVKNLREFDQVIAQQKANMGIFVCFGGHMTSGMREHADEQGILEVEGLVYRPPRLALLSVEDIMTKNLPDWLSSLLQNVTYG